MRGDRTFVERAMSALSGSGIEVPLIESDVKHSAELLTQEGLDVFVISMPGRARDGISDIQSLCAHRAFPVVVVISPIDKEVTQTMLQTGALGVVLSDELENSLAPTIRATHARQVAIPRSVRHQIFRPVLSSRENTVLAMVALGRSNTQIADSLHVEESTVKSHIRSLFAKLGVRSRKDAAAAVFDGDRQLAPGVLAVTDQHR
jgi:DNA-binding NarL/FixJ family response regulator